MHQRIAVTSAAANLQRRGLVIIEDDTLDLTTIDLDAAAAAGFDLVLCSGPTGETEACPLVLDGACPIGRPDAVVCALNSEWQQSIATAWREEGVPVAPLAPGSKPLAWPAHVGAALQAVIGQGSIAPEEDL